MQAERAQAATVLHAVMSCLALLIAMQFLLLAVAVEGFLAGEGGALWPAAAASGACCAAACWLLRVLPPPPR